MNKFGYLSFLMVIASIVFFFIIRGPNANLTVAIIVLGTFSIVGIIFALLSKKWLPGIAGVLLNGGVLAVAYLLLLAKGIAG